MTRGHCFSCKDTQYCGDCHQEEFNEDEEEESEITLSENSSNPGHQVVRIVGEYLYYKGKPLQILKTEKMDPNIKIFCTDFCFSVREINGELLLIKISRTSRKEKRRQVRSEDFGFLVGAKIPPVLLTDKDW